MDIIWVGATILNRLNGPKSMVSDWSATLYTLYNKPLINP